jgi:hypothetical protein
MDEQTQQKIDSAVKIAFAAAALLTSVGYLMRSFQKK